MGPRGRVLEGCEGRAIRGVDSETRLVLLQALAMAPGRGSGSGDGEIAMRIVLLAYYAYCAGASGTGGSFTTPWVAIPESFKDFELWVTVHNHNTGTCNVMLRESVNGVDPHDVGTSVAASGTGSSPDSRTVDGTMVCLNLSAADTAIMTLSVVLVAKQS